MNLYLRSGFNHGHYFRLIHYGTQLQCICVINIFLKDLCLRLHGGISHISLDEKPVQLAFWQRKCADHFSRILCCYYHERIRKLVGHTINGHLRFLHRLQECRLCLWGSSVDFISKDNAGKYGALYHIETLCTAPEHMKSRDIRGEHVIGKLNAFKAQMEKL